MAKQRALPVEVAVWTPNAAFMIAGLMLIARLERPGDRDLVGSLRGWITAGYHRLRPRFTSPEVADRGRVRVDAAGTATARHLRPHQFPVLLRHAAGELRADDRGLQLFRPAGRHRPQQHRYVARVHLSVLPHAHADLRNPAHQRPGSGAGDLRRAHQAQRGDGVQSLRHQPAPPRHSGAGDERNVQRGPFRVRSFLHPGCQSQAGRASQRNQGQARADLSASGAQMDFRQGLPHLLLQVFRQSRKRHGQRERLRARSEDLRSAARNFRRARAMAAVAAHLDLSERLGAPGAPAQLSRDFR